MHSAFDEIIFLEPIGCRTISECRVNPVLIFRFVQFVPRFVRGCFAHIRVGLLVYVCIAKGRGKVNNKKATASYFTAGVVRSIRCSNQQCIGSDVHKLTGSETFGKQCIGSFSIRVGSLFGDVCSHDG